MIKFFHIQLFYLLFIGSTIYAQTPQFSTNQTVAITATYPLNSTSSNKGQWLYAPGDFGSAPSGYITTIYIKPATTISSAVYTNFTIKIGHTNKTTLTTTWITGLQTCYFAASQTFNSVTTDAWLPITLQTPFTFDADKYLVIEISQITFTTGFSLRHNIVTFNGRSWGPINSVTSSGNSDNQLITGIDVIPSKHKDAGILSIDKPVNPITPGTDTIKATLLNFGTDTLKTIKLRWSVNGSPQSNPSDWTGSLLQYDSARNITFGPYNFTTGIYDIKTWTYKPDNVDDSTAFNDTASFTLYSCNPASGTYIIDSSGTSDFSTFNAALEWIKNCGISGPVTFRIKPGTYTEQLNIPPIPGASSTNTITFESYDLDSTSVILTYASNHSQFNYVVKLNGADYIIFRKMTIRATGKTYGRVVEITNNADYNILANNILQTLVTTSTNHAVIYSYYVLDQYNTIINNVISGGYYGIFMYGVSTSSMESGNIIEGNDINNFYYYGILIGYQNGISIRKNSLVNSSDSGSVYAIYSHYCYNNIVISRNNFKLTSVANIYALYMNYNTGTTSLYGNVSNNFISLGGTSTGTFYGIYMVTPAYQNISFNTVNIYGTNSTSKNCLYLTGGTSASVNLRNNIFANYCAGYAINVATTATISTSNYNDLYTTGTNVGYWTSARSNLAALQTASGKDANSVSVAPGFYTTTDLHVNTSGISNLGTPVSGITDDFDGESRSSSTPDIGADEFTLAANDAGITGLVSPLSFCAGSNTVKAAVKNYGTSILTTVIVNWQVNGTSQTPDTFSVSLSQYQEATVTLGTYNFSAGTSYNIKMWSSKPNSSNDGNNKNDTFLIQNRQSGLNGTYTIGATSANYKTFNAAISDLKTRGICGAVVFRVYAGNYNEYFSIPAITGISSNNTITFESYNHDSTSVDLNYESTKATYNYVVELNGADYITFRQITIRATGTSYGIAVSITGGSDYNTFSNNIIQTKAGSGSWNFGGIISTESIDNYNSIINNIISGGNHGIRFTGSNTTSENKNIIKNNWIKDFYSFGVSTLYQRAITIENNRIQNDTSATGPYGIGITYTNDSIKVIKNRIELSGHAGNTGIYGYYCVGATTAPGMIANNFISQKGVVTGSNYGIYLYFCSYQNFFNNTVRLDDKGTVFYAYNGSYIRLLNNIMATFGGGYAMYVTPGSNLASSDYNDFYTTGPVLCFWGSDLSDLAAWKSATAKDTHSLSVDPFFYSSSDLHVYSRMLDSAGIPISSVKTDIDNQFRDPNKPDIGADEFDKFYRDAGIIQYIGPNVPCPASATNVMVKLKNYGCSSIDTIIIKWTVNGILQTPKTYSGNLAPLMDTIIDIGTFTFNAGNSYDLKVWTDSINGGTDQLHLNDTISVKGIRAGKSGTYTIGPSGRDYPSFNAAVNDLISNGVCGPVSFIADTGSYNEQISIPSISGASSTNTVTFKSVSNDSSLVNLNFTSTNTTNNYVVELKGADYITFKKIKIKSNSSTYARAVHILEGSDYNNFTCNQILSSLSGSNNVNTSGIYSENSLDDYNTFTNNYIQGGYYGIYLSGLDDKTRENFNTIKNNIIRDCYSAGISFYYQNSPEVSGNLIEAKYTNYGIYGYCSYDSTIITGNRVSISGWGGARYCLSVNTTVGTPAKSALIANNSLSQKESTSGSNVGLEVNGTTYLNIFYNSVNIRSSSTGMISGLFINSASYINVINNIFAVKEKGYAVIVGNPGTSFNSDYNNFITDGATFGDWTTAQLATLDDWKVRSKVDIHSISIDPYFYSDIDLHPYSIKLDKSAIPLSEVKTDIDNKVRNTTHPDIGAYEIDPFNFDASIESVVEPLPPCAGVMNNVVVKLKNYGNTTINSTKIKWSVNDTLQTPYNFTGSVPNLKDTTILIGSFKFYKGKSYRLKFWADTINSVADQNHRNDTFRIKNMTTGLGDTLRIGPIGKDYPTFNAAITDMLQYGVCSKTVFMVDAGTYNERISIPPVYGASDSNTITFRSASGDSTSVIISNASNSSIYDYVLQLDGTDYIRFEYMTIKSTSTSTYLRVIDIQNGSEQNIFRNNIIQCIVTSYSDAVGIYMNASSVNDNLIENNRIEDGYYGIYMFNYSANNPGKRNVIRNNKFSRLYYGGIYITSQDSLEISNNVITNSTASYVLYGISCKNVMNNSRIINNQIQLNSKSTMFGIYLDNCTGTPDKIPLIANNFISISGTYTGSAVYGLCCINGYYNNIFHNSIKVACGSSFSNCIYLDGPASGNFGHIDLRNNILVNTATGYAIDVSSTAVTDNYLRTSDYNDLYTKGTTLGYYGSTSVTNLANWRTTTSKDLHSISVDALFKSATDLHLTNYTSFVLATPLNEVPYDIDGALRSIKPTIGADERPVIANDAGITGFVSPKLIGCDGSLPIVVKLTNFGTNKLSSVKINTKINGLSMSAYTFSGSLGYLHDTTVLIGYATFTYGTNYKIVATTQSPNGIPDQYADNNSDSMQILKLYPFPVIKSVTNDSVCKGTKASLSVSSDNSSSLYWYDSLIGGTLLAEVPSFITGTLQSSRTYYVEAATKGDPDSLMTSNQSGPSEMGNMFDVQALNTDIIIDSFSVQPAVLSGISLPMAIYYKKGSYVGYEYRDNAWTLLGVDTIVSKGLSKFVFLNIGNLKIKAGDTVALYVTTTDINALITFTDTAKIISDYYLRISCGTKAFYPFDTFYQTRKTWNGKIFYSAGSLCTSARISVEAVVNPLPAKDLGPEGKICTGQNTILKTAKVSGFSYIWKTTSKPDTLSFSDSLIANTPGTYIVYISDQCGFSAVDSINLILKSTPQANFTVNNSTQCFRGNYFNFTNASSFNGTSLKGYTWNFGDMVINHDTNTSHTYSTENNFKVTLTAIAANDCQDSISKTVVVNPQPKAIFTMNDTSQCLTCNSFISTNNSAIKSGTLTYVWKLGDGNTSTNKNFTHPYASTGNYQVQLKATSNYSCKDSVTSMVYVNPQPLIDLGKDTTLKHNETITLNAGAGMNSYLWSGGETSQQLTIDTTGVGDVGTKTIWVKVEKNGCFSTDTILIHFIHNDAISEDAYRNTITVYPNPATNEIFIVSSIPNGEKIKVTMLNEYGKEVCEVFNGINNGNLLRIDATQFVSGVYFVKLESETTCRLAKIVIMK